MEYKRYIPLFETKKDKYLKIWDKETHKLLKSLNDEMFDKDPPYLSIYIPLSKKVVNSFLKYNTFFKNFYPNPNSVDKAPEKEKETIFVKELKNTGFYSDLIDKIEHIYNTKFIIEKLKYNYKNQILFLELKVK